MAVKVKICGLTNLADAQAAVSAGADLLGFIFFPKSPRYAPPERVREIIRALELERGQATADRRRLSVPLEGTTAEERTYHENTKGEWVLSWLSF